MAQIDRIPYAPSSGAMPVGPQNCVLGRAGGFLELPAFQAASGGIFCHPYMAANTKHFFKFIENTHLSDPTDLAAAIRKSTSNQFLLPCSMSPQVGALSYARSKERRTGQLSLHALS